LRQGGPTEANTQNSGNQKAIHNQPP
jgi:hypothetical protein